MNRFLLIFLLFSIQAAAQAPQPDYAASSIEASRAWIDIDYVGDGLTGHKLDILLPKQAVHLFRLLFASMEVRGLPII